MYSGSGIRVCTVGVQAPYFNKTNGINSYTASALSDTVCVIYDPESGGLVFDPEIQDCFDNDFQPYFGQCKINCPGGEV